LAGQTSGYRFNLWYSCLLLIVVFSHNSLSLCSQVSFAAYLGDPTGPHGEHVRDGFTAVGGPSIQPLLPGAFDAVVRSVTGPSFPDDDFTASLPGLPSFFASFSYLNGSDFYLTYFFLLFRFLPCRQRLTCAIFATPEFMDTFAYGFFASC
jgi:hypothetical protein